MLVFDDKFLLGDRRDHCTLWASDPELKRVTFEIDLKTLSSSNGEAQPVCDFAELTLCEGERAKIEAACRRAFANRPSRHIQLESDDFST